MNVTDTELDRLVIISVDGELDRSNIDVLSDLLDGHVIKKHYCLLLDLGSCSYVDASGLRVMRSFLEAIRGKGMLAVVASRSVDRLLEIVGLTDSQDIRVYQDRTDAMAAVCAVDR